MGSGQCARQRSAVRSKGDAGGGGGRHPRPPSCRRVCPPLPRAHGPGVALAAVACSSNRSQAVEMMGPEMAQSAQSRATAKDRAIHGARGAASPPPPLPTADNGRQRAHSRFPRRPRFARRAMSPRIWRRCRRSRSTPRCSWPMLYRRARCRGGCRWSGSIGSTRRRTRRRSFRAAASSCSTCCPAACTAGTRCRRPSRVG